MIIRPALMRATALLDREADLRAHARVQTGSDAASGLRAGSCFTRRGRRMAHRALRPPAHRLAPFVTRLTIHLPRSGLVEQPREVARQQIHLEVHARPARVAAGGRDLGAVRDERHIAVVVPARAIVRLTPSTASEPFSAT